MVGSEVRPACAVFLYARVCLARGICAVLDESDADLPQDPLQSFVKARIVLHAAYCSLPHCLVLWAQNGGTTFALFKRSAKEGKSAAKKVEKKGKQAQQTIRKAAPKPKSIPQKARRLLGPSSVYTFDITKIRCIQHFC